VRSVGRICDPIQLLDAARSWVVSTLQTPFFSHRDFSFGVAIAVRKWAGWMLVGPRTEQVVSVILGLNGAVWLVMAESRDCSCARSFPTSTRCFASDFSWHLSCRYLYLAGLLWCLFFDVCSLYLLRCRHVDHQTVN
jgi:hypothetical protein